MTEITVEFDVDAIVAGNAESVVAKLSSLTDKQLEHVAMAETAQPKPRSTVLNAIEAERQARASMGSAGDPSDPAAGGNPLAEATEQALAAQAAKISELEATLALRDQEIADLRDAIGQQQQAKEKAVKPQLMKVTADLPDLSEASEVRVVCVDAENMTLRGVSPLLFAPHQFKPERGGLVLDAPIAFPRELPETEVAGLILVTGGKAGLRAEFVQPIVIGGGKGMELPRGHVRFMAAPAKD